MLAFFKWLGGFLSGGIAQDLAEAYKASKDAATEQERIAANERVSRLEAIRDLQIAEAGSRLNAVMRFFIAIGPALYLFKIFVVDKIACPVLGLPNALCRTDPLDPNLWTVVTAVIGFYFLYEGGIGIARIVKRK
jgi:hypothetical protein